MSRPIPAPDLLSHFWTPVCAVGSHGPRGPNAQVCVSVFGAGIVPDRPRLLVGLYRTNYTTELVQQSGTLAVSLLAESQAGSLGPLGLESGRDGPKLDGLGCALTPSGDPYFPDSVGMLDCAVIESFDMGDAMAFLCAVRERRSLAGGAPLTTTRLRELASADFLARWGAKNLREQALSRESMHWLAG